MKDWINIGALGVLGVTVIASLTALACKVEVQAVELIAGPIISGCFAVVNRGAVP